MAFQLTLTTLPGDTLPKLGAAFRVDWLAHFCIYFGLGFLLARAWLLSGRRPAALVWMWLATAIFGLLDELHEMLIPGRGLEMMDWLMDVAGSNCGLIVGTLMMRTRWARLLH